MADSNIPLVALDPAGKAPIISYNVPDPVSYPMTHLMELRVEAGLLKAAPPAPQPPQQVNTNAALREALTTGVFRADVFPLALSRQPKLALINNDFAKAQEAAASPDIATLGSPAPVARYIPKMPVDAIAQELARGKMLNLRRNLFGTLVAETIDPPPAQPVPRLMIVERYRLSSFLGQYGAGRTLNTFTLLPGEKTSITIKSYTKTTTEAEQASSILDSFSDSSADDFEKSLESEQSDRSKQDSATSFEASMEGQYGVSFATHVSAKAGFKTSSASSREQFSRSVANATSKHSQTASAKRDVKVDTTNKQTSEAGSEQVVVREIANINVGRTLNFVFRQMLQEFITVIHLVDLKIAYWDGVPQNKREVPLHQLDELLEEFAQDAAAAKKLRAAVLDAVRKVVDWQGETQKFVEEHRPFEDEPAYLRVVPKLGDEYRDATGNQFAVPGIIVRADKYTMRTEGVIVEALLGQGNALDPYSMSLQQEAVRSKTLQNDALEDVAAQAGLGRTVVDTGTPAQAEAFQKVFYAPPVVDDDD
jgi:hypothetical protein